MSVEAFLSSLGLVDIFNQVGFETLTILLFISSLVICMMAFQAAGAARKARNEAKGYLKSAQDLALEVRHLTAQVEKATHKRATAASSGPVRVGASETTEEAEISIIDAPTDESSYDEDDRLANEANGRTLEEAKKAATVPSALLGGFLRRKS